MTFRAIVDWPSCGLRDYFGEGALMVHWEYALLSDPDTGTDGVSFSHSQGDELVPEFSRTLGRGLKAENSNPLFLHLNLNHVSPILVCGVLGNRGWELVGFSTLTGGHAYWMFKKEREVGADLGAMSG